MAGVPQQIFCDAVDHSNLRLPEKKEKKYGYCDISAAYKIINSKNIKNEDNSAYQNMGSSIIPFQFTNTKKDVLNFTSKETTIN